MIDPIFEVFAFISRLTRIAAAVLLAAGCSSTAAAVDDVCCKRWTAKSSPASSTMPKLLGTLGQRVLSPDSFLSELSLGEPRFRLPWRPATPACRQAPSGFHSNHDVSFDLLPMSIGPVASNLFYWDGSDAKAVTASTFPMSSFVVPTSRFVGSVRCQLQCVCRGRHGPLVPGGLIQRTSADIGPFDGVDSGTMHKHLALQLNDNDGNSGTTPAAGNLHDLLAGPVGGLRNVRPVFLCPPHVRRSPTLFAIWPSIGPRPTSICSHRPPFCRATTTATAP